MEVIYGAEKTGMALSDYLAMLRDEGLGSLPGTTAEILGDGVRRLLSHAKIAVEQWVDVIPTAQDVLRHRHGLVEGLTVLLLEINRRYKSRGTGIRVTEISGGDQVTG
jgi:FO synthase